ncbi:hypothetical protein BPOR_0157g00100 [Botrytis porri]|uniref:Methylated-DNA-[protein]-cysteine S-methyltransferase DNA binding domain-containing protein n=1 Tax=Botrytis porri TaxID=87229 RepID=A0A4Z1KVH1_9HELO|nr:hypothetical protein BPOR_0157g00100 [Botrytis porri]
MPRTDEATSFYHSVYSAIQEIPYGKVTTYGHIARAPSTSTSTSTTISPDSPSHLFHNGNVPWQRVINAKGGISPRSHPSGAQNQAAILRSEGIEVTIGSLNTLLISLPTYGWFPRQLPSEEAAGIDPPINSDSESDSPGADESHDAEE